jgi:hypothetical protein
MRNKKLSMVLLVCALLVLTLAVSGALAWDGSITWTGQGDTSVNCEEIGPGWMHWILNGAKDVPDLDAELVLAGSGSGTYAPYKKTPGGVLHFLTPYYLIFNSDGTYALTAVVNYNGELSGNPQLTISHYCPGGYVPPQNTITVIKTVETSYTRTHHWSIDKSVDTGFTEDDTPKIWLYIPGYGPDTGTATYTIDVTYKGYTDSDFCVKGDITILNSLYGYDATITSVVDKLVETDGTETEIEVVWPEDVTFPYILPKGGTLTGTYGPICDDEKIVGDNVVTVTFKVDEDEYTTGAIEKIVWGDPTTEVNANVEITDTNPEFSDKYGDENGQVILYADDFSGPGDYAEFTYDKEFNWEDYGKDNCGDHIYENTAKVIGDDGVVLDYASATLKVNVQCYIYETAYAKGNDPYCFTLYGFDNWGWTNKISAAGIYTWDLWAGAGQCDTDKGTLVGSVKVVAEVVGGKICVTDVDWELNELYYILEETHVYAGCTAIPHVKLGKKWVDTVAPGQYTMTCCSDYPIWVIAHAVVGIPDPNFGP